MGRLAERWQAILDHPILRLEVRRIRRGRWWPGQRFFMFYPALLGATLCYGVMLVVSDSPSVVCCLPNVVTLFLGFALPWIAPALTAVTIARERELGTLDLLRTTLLTERSIVLGKLGGCLAGLWPGILTLALLTPFQLQIVQAVGGGLLDSLSVLHVLMKDSGFDAKWLWVWLLPTDVIGLFKPWCDLAFNAAMGLFVSTLARSSGVAIAVSYGVILVVRVALWLAISILWSYVILGLVPLAIVLVEIVGAASLVWGAIWWLKRM